jgi:hypothetical protein
LRAPRKFLAILIAMASFCCVMAAWLVARADNPPTTDIVGAIEGEAISVEGPMSVEATHGVVRTILRSGSNVHVKSGQARVELVEGGQIVVCGPAHFSVLKSGKSLTIALDSGTIHAHIENEPTLSVFTPQIQANPISIGNGAQDIVVGVESTGNMCIRANRGAVRIEQQLTGQSVLVPQNGDISLANGQLETMNNSTGHCECELVKAAKPSTATTEVSRLATPEDVQKRASEKKIVPNAELPPRVAPQEPIYQVFMPPLQYDATKKVQADYDPNLVVLVRRVRVRPTLILQGRVEGDPVVAQTTKPAPEPAKPGAVSKPSEDTTWNRVRTFFHKLWSPTS